MTEQADVVRDILLWAKARFGWEPRPGQTEMMRAIHQHQKITYRIGRQFGKTECLALIGLYQAWTKVFPIVRDGNIVGFRGSRTLMASAKDDWAETLYERTRAFLDRNDEMRRMVQEGMERRGERTNRRTGDGPRAAIKIRLSPYKRIIFPNGSTIDFRGPGDKGEGPRSKTYDFKIIDEADYMPKTYWVAEGPTSINAPAALTVLSSTPTGKREHFYRACTDPKMGYKEFHFSGEENPMLTPDKKQDLLDELGPEEYDREIRANWGTIMSGVFPSELLDKAVFVDGYLKITANANEIHDVVGHVEHLVREWASKERLKNLILGADLGTSAKSPCEILLGEPDGKNLDVVGIISLNAASWPEIEKVLEVLDNELQIQAMALDATGVGSPVCEHLQQNGKIQSEILPFDFSTTLTVSENLRKNAKAWTTDSIISMLQHGNLGLPDDENLLYQFRNHTVDLSRGRPKYSKIDDHIVDAARCLVYAFFKERFQNSTERRDGRRNAEDSPPFVALVGVKMRSPIPAPYFGKMKVCAIKIS